MRRFAVAVLALVVVASGCIGGETEETPPQNDINDTEPVEGSSEQETTAKYLGASDDVRSASDRLDYSDTAEIAAEPQGPGESSVHAAYLRVPINHGGDSFEDVMVDYRGADVSQVSRDDIGSLVVDRGINNTIQAVGDEDYELR